MYTTHTHTPLPGDTGSKLFVISYWTGSTDTSSRTMQSSLNRSWKLHWEYGSLSASRVTSYRRRGPSRTTAPHLHYVHIQCLYYVHN